MDPVVRKSLEAEGMETWNQTFSEYSNLVSFVYVSTTDVNFFHWENVFHLVDQYS